MVCSIYNMPPDAVSAARPARKRQGTLCREGKETGALPSYEKAYKQEKTELSWERQGSAKYCHQFPFVHKVLTNRHFCL